MITKMTHITLYVKDEEEALAFYRDKVGMKVHTDVTFSGMRWLTLNVPDQPDLELVLFKATKPESQALVGKQSPEGPLLVFATDDIKGDFEQLRDRGITFTQEPVEKAWGKEAMFHDLYGNVIMLYQD